MGFGLRQIVDAFKKGTGGVTKGKLFQLWQDHSGDWAEVAFTSGLKLRTIDSVTNKHNLKTRAQILAVIGNEEAVDEIIATKTKMGHFVDHPDCPHRIECRLFFTFDTTVWEDGTSKEQEDHLALQTGVLSPEDALRFYNQMTAAPNGGPTSFSRPPPLSLGFRSGGPDVDGESDRPGGCKGKGKGKGKKDKAPAKAHLTSGETPQTEGAGQQPEPKPKPLKKVTIETHFKIMTKVLEEISNIEWLINEVKERPGGSPFAAFMRDHQVKISALYECMRLATTGTNPNMDCRWC